MSPKDALESLVLALDATSWSSWQATARFSMQHEAARAVLEQERIRDAAPELLAALRSLDDACCADLEDRENRITFRKALISSRAAIAKATGGAS